jgi:hypothetical protein
MLANSIQKFVIFMCYLTMRMKLMHNKIRRTCLFKCPPSKLFNVLLSFTGLFNETIPNAKVMKRLITEICAQRIENLDETVVVCSKILFQGLRKSEIFNEDRVSKQRFETGNLPNRNQEHHLLHSVIQFLNGCQEI